jgi:hypothetical protein
MIINVTKRIRKNVINEKGILSAHHLQHSGCRFVYTLQLLSLLIPLFSDSHQEYIPIRLLTNKHQHINCKQSLQLMQ